MKNCITRKICIALFLVCAAIAGLIVPIQHAHSQGVVVVHKKKNVATTFSPSDISGLNLWLKADALPQIDGDRVATWTDSSIAANDATQATDSNKPHLKQNILNQLPVLRMTISGSGAWLSCGSTATYKQFFAVAKYSAATFNDYDGLITGSSTVGVFQGDIGTSHFYDMAETTSYFKDGVSYAENNQQGPMNAFAIMSISNAAGWTIPPRIGNDFSGLSRFWNGDVAEIIAYDSVLSSTDRDRVYNYLNDKWFVNKSLSEIGLAYLGDSKTVFYNYQPTLIASLHSNFTNVYSSMAGRNGADLDLLNIDVVNWLNTDPVEPDFVLLNIGINDTGFSQSYIENGLGNVLDAIHAKWPATHILVMRIWGRTHDTFCDAFDDTYIPNVLTSRSSFASVGPDERVFLKGSDDGATMTSDGIHPNTLGYAETAAQWRTAMQPFLAGLLRPVAKPNVVAFRRDSASRARTLQRQRRWLKAA